jgi:hypothetical protein
MQKVLAGHEGVSANAGPSLRAATPPSAINEEAASTTSRRDRRIFNPFLSQSCDIRWSGESGSGPDLPSMMVAGQAPAHAG